MDEVEEESKNLVLGDERLAVSWFGPGGTIIREEGQNEFEHVGVKVVDVDGEKERGENTALGNARSSRKPVREDA